MAKITCTRLTRKTKTTVAELNILLKQLSSSSRPVTDRSLDSILASKHVYLMVARDEKKIIGMGSLITWNAPTGIRSRIEDVVVDEAYRGKGLGAMVTRSLIVVAKKVKVKDIQLSSRAGRVAANALYKNLGFEMKETNVYQMKL